MGGGGTKPMNLEENEAISCKHDGKFYIYLDITCEDYPLVHKSGDGYKSKDTTKRHVSPRPRTAASCLRRPSPAPPRRPVTARRHIMMHRCDTVTSSSCKV